MKQPKILVIGDCGLDMLISGIVHGTAPEAPIPVLKVQREEYRLGMAANVAVQLSKFCKPHLWTFFKSGTGKDFLNFQQFENQMIVNGLAYNWKHFESEFPLIVKQRTAVGNTYISRNDYETVCPVNIIESIKPHVKELKKFDAIILSDYGKNVIGEAEDLIRFLQQHTKAKIFIDPDKFKKDYVYMDAYCIKANKKEAEALTEQSGVTEAIASMPVKWAIVTDGENGCFTLSDNEYHWVHAAKVKKVVDVTGAGDTFMASLVYHHCIGYNKLKSVKQANKDAAKCVERFGV